MYVDNVVISGIIILVLTCVFLVVIGWFAWRHISCDVPVVSGSLIDDQDRQ